MKVILSRKGFDSKNGGSASPIYNNMFYSFPIPEEDTNTQYADINFINGSKLSKVMNDLGIHTIPEAHLDPDLRSGSLNRRPKLWKSAFGQQGTSQKFLANQIISPGDIFLFFGWFKEVQYINNSFKYVKNAPDIHAIFGYLQVEKIIDVEKDGVPIGVLKHPHVVLNDSYTNNILYIGRDRLSFNNNKLGSGIFQYNNNLVLTKKNETRSVWELPGIFLGESSNFHISNKIKSLPNRNVELRVRGQGQQEMFISDTPSIVFWAQNLINNCNTY